MARPTTTKKEIPHVSASEAGSDTASGTALTDTAPEAGVPWNRLPPTEASTPHADHEGKTAFLDDDDDNEEDDTPTPASIKRRIIRRVSELVDVCTDPKKLMDTYEAISKCEREAGQQRETLFERIARELAENEEPGDE